MDPLNQITSVIPAARRFAIRRLISDAVKRGEVSSTRDASFQLTALTRKVTQSNVDSIMITRYATEGERISSEDWNDTQNEVFVDLHALYEQIKNINTLSTRHSEINRSDLRQSKAAIIKAINDVRLYQFLKEFPQYQDVKFVNFSDARNLATRRPFANIDDRIRVLELPPRTKDRIQQQNLDLRSTTVTVNLLGGGTAGGFDESFKEGDMLDDNPDTFWAELVMTDGRVQQTYVPSADAGLGTKFNSNGIIAEVDLHLSNTQRMNNISFLPFCEYPIRVVDLAYKETPHANTWIKVPSFQVAEPSSDWYEWSFSPINVAVLRIVMEQTNFTTNIFHLPENLVHNQALWSQILNERYDQSIHQVELTDIQLGQVAAEPEQLAYLNAIDQVDDVIDTFAYTNERGQDHYSIVNNLIKASGKILSKITPTSINDVLTPLGGEKEPDSDNPDLVEIRKHEFVFGVRSIETAFSLYQPIAFYDSPKFVSGATILETSLEVDEQHPTFNDGLSDFHRTSIEYEVEIGANTRFNIVPANYETVSGPAGDVGYQVPDEYIEILRTTRVGFTRLKPLSLNVLVRKNGERINFSDYVFSIDSVSSNLGRLEIVENYDPNAIYTVSYTATQDSAIVDINALFNSTDLLTGEIFTNTNRNNTIKASYFPYIEYEIVNNTGRWIRDDDEDAVWRFNPTVQNYKAGTVEVASGVVNVTGSGTDFTGNMDLSAGIDNVFRIKGETKVYDIESVSSSTVLTLTEAYDGTTTGGLEYQIGQAFKADGRTYALDNILYEPIKIFVNDIKAFNLTDYRTLEHPAFIPDERPGRQYQFIHAGQLLYFNKPITGAKIEIFYAWLTQYVQVKMTMRCNIPVRTDITPKLNDFTVRIKNSRL